MAERRIGLSLSLCVGDVIAGQVSEDEIHTIVAGTAARTSEDIAELMASYRYNYWQDAPDEGERIARELFANDRVYQPRLEGRPAPNPIPLRWLDAVENWQESYPTSSI